MSELNPDGKSDISKHSRLIYDYKSLRDKYNILKNAILKEKSKTKSLEDSISEINIQSRKVNQEMDSLKFRNDLLTKQLNILREELEQERMKKHKKLSKTLEQSTEIEIIKEDLINKITECSTLHSKVDELNMNHKLEINILKSAITDLENQLKLIQGQKESVENNIKVSLTKEIEDRHKLENKLEHKEQAIIKLRQNEQNLIKELSDLKSQMNEVSNSPSKTLQEINCVKEETKSLEDVKSIDKSASNSQIAGINTNDGYMCSLIDRISSLEKELSASELKQEIAWRRYETEKVNREELEKLVDKNGLEKPQIVTVHKTSSNIDSSCNIKQIELIDLNSEFYQQKIEKLTQYTYQTIAKCSIYYDELKAAEQRWEIENIEKSFIQSENDNLKKEITRLQEDLEITRHQYEDKMKEMSIHIAELCNQSSSNNHNNPRKSDLSSNKTESSTKGFFDAFKKL